MAEKRFAAGTGGTSNVGYVGMHQRPGLIFHLKKKSKFWPVLDFWKCCHFCSVILRQRVSSFL